jgi:hypothetical protein
MFEDPTKITAPAAAALSALLGLPAVFIGLYKWLRPKVSK